MFTGPRIIETWNCAPFITHLSISEILCWPPENSLRTRYPAISRDRSVENPVYFLIKILLLPVHIGIYRICRYNFASLQDCILGLEFSGRDSKGQRVMGILAARGLATSVLADPLFLWPVPSSWTLEQAATVPVVFSTVSATQIIKSNFNDCFCFFFLILVITINFGIYFFLIPFRLVY